MATKTKKLTAALPGRVTKLRDEAVARLDRSQRRVAQKALISAMGIRHALVTRVLAVGESGIDVAGKVTRPVPFSRPLHKVFDTSAKSLRATQSKLAQLPIDDYDELNVRKVADALDTLDAWQLTRVRAYEVENKNRKTVLGAIDRRLA